MIARVGVPPSASRRAAVKENLGRRGEAGERGLTGQLASKGQRERRAAAHPYSPAVCSHAFQWCGSVSKMVPSRSKIAPRAAMGSSASPGEDMAGAARPLVKAFFFRAGLLV